MLALLAAIAIRRRSRRRVPASGGGRAGLYRLCSAAIACRSCCSRHVPAIGRPVGAWEGLLLKPLSGAERNAGI